MAEAGSGADTTAGSADASAGFIPTGCTLPLNEKLEAGVTGWHNVDASVFKLRVGPNYKKTGKKEPSAPAMFTIRSVDCFRMCAPCQQLTPHMKRPDPLVTSPLDDIPSQICTNILFPEEAPSMFGVSEGQTSCMFLTFEMTEDTAAAIKDYPNIEPAFKLMVDYFRGKTDMNNPLKLMAQCLNWEATKLPGILKRYNSKPILINNSSAVHYGPDNVWIEQVVNIHKFSYIARKGLNSISNKIENIHFHIAGCIEGRKDDEMPERALFAAEFNELPIFSGEHRLTDEAVAWFRKQTGDPVKEKKGKKKGTS